MGVSAKTMRAIGIPVPGGPEALVVEERPVPALGAGEILIKIAHAGINRPDVFAAPRGLSAAARCPRYSWPGSGRNSDGAGRRRAAVSTR